MILIDKAEVMEAVQADMDVTVTGHENMENVARMMRDILSTISDSPEIEVIQCKDCARSATCFTYRETGDGEGFCKWAE
ncbi:MAG: hypothetical protein IKD59_01135, partial [Lachnospiraceae bacterium]|nr:hypothetical protein [Lachnospiraceae bacterium]